MPISQAAGRRELLAELIGTGMITFFGTGVVAASVYLGAMNGLWQVAVVWGIAVMLAAFCTVPSKKHTVAQEHPRTVIA